MSILEGIPTEKLTVEQERDSTPEDLVLFTLREAYCYSRGCWQSRGLSEGETLSACYEGLQSAATNFQPSRGRFFSYAKAYVRGALSRAIRGNDVVKKSTVEQLPTETDDDEETVECPMPKPAYIPPHTLPDHDGFVAKDEWDRLVPTLRRILSERARMVLELRYKGGLSLLEIANLLGISRAAVSYTELVALKKIRNVLMDRGEFFERP